MTIHNTHLLYKHKEKLIDLGKNIFFIDIGFDNIKTVTIKRQDVNIGAQKIIRIFMF